MSLTPSTMSDLGSRAPDFNLPDVISNRTMSYIHTAGPKGTLVMFICNHCPYVIHVQDEIARIAEDYKDEGIGFVAISSNDVDKYPDDGPEGMRDQAERVGFNFPYLYDESQEVARAYDAACTPDFFLFDSSGTLVYRGRMDESRPGNDVPVSGKDLREALDSLLAGKEQSEQQYPSMGCNIKWRD